MVERPKITIALGQEITDWLREQVKSGKDASVGWAITRLVREEQEREMSKKQHEKE